MGPQVFFQTYRNAISLLKEDSVKHNKVGTNKEFGSIFNCIEKSPTLLY